MPLNMAFPALLFFLIGGLCGLGVMRTKLSIHKIIMAVLTGAMFLVGAAFLVPIINVKLSGVFWFLFKVAVILYCFIWYRGTFPRFRYDQLMTIGWKYMIPIGMGALLVNGIVLLVK